MKRRERLARIERLQGLLSAMLPLTEHHEVVRYNELDGELRELLHQEANRVEQRVVVETKSRSWQVVLTLFAQPSDVAAGTLTVVHSGKSEYVFRLLPEDLENIYEAIEEVL